MLAEKSNKVFGKTFGLLVALGLLAAVPLYANGVFVDAGGPYEGDVGEEIEFDAGASQISNGAEIDGYYWDWDYDGHWDECFTSPTAKHAWHSAIFGKVRVYIFYPGGVDWADARVTIKGPDTAMSITVSSSVELRLRNQLGQFIGLNPDTNLFDMEIAHATMTLVPRTVNGVAEFKEAPTAQWSTEYTLSLVHGSTYGLTLTGAETGWFEVRVQGLQDGACCSDEFLVGIINEGEEILLDISACCKDGSLAIDCGPLRYCPEMKVDPDDKVELDVQPGGRYDATITISETEGLRPLCGVVLTCSELTGTVYTIPVSDIHFNPTAFNVAAGGKQEVTMTVEIPEFFIGQVTGTVTVQCAGDQREEIDVIVRKAGTHAPTIEVVSPVYGVVGAPVEFDATGSNDRDGGIEEYCWDWDLTGQYECFEDPICEHTWDRAFNGIVRLRVVDDEGNTTEQYVQVVVTD